MKEKKRIPPNTELWKRAGWKRAWIVIREKVKEEKQKEKKKDMKTSKKGRNFNSQSRRQGDEDKDNNIEHMCCNKRCLDNCKI